MTLVEVRCRARSCEDHRPVAHLIKAVVESGEPQTAEMESWQVSGRWPVIEAQEMFERL